MAQIDPERERRIKKIITGAAEALRKIGESAGEAALAVKDLAFELDEEGNKKATYLAAEAIDKARSK